MAQVVAVAEAFHRGSERYHPHQNEKPPRSFAVIMAGRLDDHLRDLAKANSLGIPEEVLTKAGLAVVKQAYQVFQECGYQSRLLIGGMRGLYHVTELAGGDMVLTVAPAMQAATLREDVAFHRSIHDPISRDTIELLWTIDDFRKAYDIDGMHPTDFATFGAFVKTQGQFIDNYRALQEFISQALTG
jgi:transaldolase